MKTSRTIALASLVAFAIQVAFALLMLRLFTPDEVGEFSVISQIGFFWMTLALSQSQLGLLANHHEPAHLAARKAWKASMWRGLGLLPLAAAAVWFTQLSFGSALLWALLLALCQVGWILAQSLTLRVGSAWQQAAVRVLPPATAAFSALTTVMLGSTLAWSGPTLLLSALLGYAVGSTWLVPALLKRTHASSSLHVTPDAEQSDSRSATLRMMHTLADALLATAIIVVWQRLYGSQETGWMCALLRVLGFLPAVVHMAWAQVALAQGKSAHNSAAWSNPWWLGVGAFVCVIGLGATCALALQQGWLDAKWLGVWSYITPLVIWQGSACMSAAFSHLPFQNQSARHYSQLCIVGACTQMLVLTMPLMLNIDVAAIDLIQIFAGYSTLYLLVLTVWLSRRPAVMNSQSNPK